MNAVIDLKIDGIPSDGDVLETVLEAIGVPRLFIIAATSALALWGWFGYVRYATKGGRWLLASAATNVPKSVGEALDAISRLLVSCVFALLLLLASQPPTLSSSAQPLCSDESCGVLGYRHLLGALTEPESYALLVSGTMLGVLIAIEASIAVLGSAVGLIKLVARILWLPLMMAFYLGIAGTGVLTIVLVFQARSEGFEKTFETLGIHFSFMALLFGLVFASLYLIGSWEYRDQRHGRSVDYLW